MAVSIQYLGQTENVFMFTTKERNVELVVLHIHAKKPDSNPIVTVVVMRIKKMQLEKQDSHELTFNVLRIES